MYADGHLSEEAQVHRRRGGARTGAVALDRSGGTARFLLGPRSGPSSAPSVLALQSRIGNRAVAQLLSVQRRATETGLKKEHAQKVLGNHLKGDPPFKPQKGNFGRVSWFKGTGNPYVGGQAQSYDVIVDVDITPDPAALAADYFRRFKRQYVQNTGADLGDQSTHHAFWAALGQTLEGRGAAEVPVDQSEVSRQGAGTFLTVDATARSRITLTNPAKLEADLGTKGVHTDLLHQLLLAREKSREPTFTVQFAAVKASVLATTKPIAGLQAVLAQPADIRVGQKEFPAMGWGAAKSEPTTEFTYTLTYANYRTARLQVKKLMNAIKAGRLAPYGVVKVVPGKGWSGKEVKAYSD